MCRLAPSQGPGFLVNSRLGLMSAPTSPWGPFSRSYGANLPSSFTRVLSPAWGDLPRPPVSVCGTDPRPLRSRFSCPRLLLPPPRLAPWRWSDWAVTLPIVHPATPTRGERGPGASRDPHQGRGGSDYQPMLHRLRLNASGLGPPNPTRIHLASETLGLRRARFSRAFTLLIPAFALRSAPRPLPSTASPPPNAPLPLPPKGESTGSVRGLSPGPLSARGRSTSELLRTLSRMAASKPTSWLFGRPHLLGH